MLALAACAAPQAALSGTVVDETGAPLPGAVVRVKATEIETLSDQQGHFSFDGLTPCEAVFVTAWASGYYINGVDDVRPGDKQVEIILHAHHDGDNPDYDWLVATYAAGQGEGQGRRQGLQGGRVILKFF